MDYWFDGILLLLLFILSGSLIILWKKYKSILTDSKANPEVPDIINKHAFRFISFVENLIDGIIIVENLDIVFANNTAVRLFKYDNIFDLKKVDIHDLFKPEYHYILEKKVLTEQQEDELFTIEARAVRKDNSTFHVNITIGFLNNDNNPVKQLVIKDISAYHNSFVTIKQQEIQLRTLFEYIPDAIFVVDPLTAIIKDTNPAATTLTGYSQEQIIGMHLAAIHPIPDEKQDRIRVFFDAYAENEPPREHNSPIEYTVLTKDGNKIPVEIVINILSVNNETMILATYRDISRRKRSEALLFESETRYRNLTDEAPLCIITCNTEGSILYANSRSTEITGLPVRELISGVNMFKYQSFIDAGLSTKLIYCIKNDKKVIIEFPYTNVKDEFIYARTHISVLKNSKNKIIGALTIVEDFTDYKEIERSIRLSEYKLQKILDSLQVGVILIDMETCTIVDINAFAVRMFGIPKEKFIGRINEEYRSKKFKNKPESYESFIVNAKKRKLPVIKTVVPIVFNNRTFLLENFVDITDQKTTELELKIAKQEADEASLAKSRFLANMSHEIRTPMNGVIGIAQLIKRGEDSDKLGEYIDMIIDSAQSLITIINDILDISKIEENRIDFEEITFNIIDLLKSIAESFQFRAKQKGIDCISKIDDKIPVFVKGDPTRLKQIFINMMGNAVKFTHRGKIELKADLVEKTDEQVILAFQVIDSGIGIPKNKIEKIFEMFTQADSGMTRLYGGTGLGLSITKRLVEIMGGALTVKSKEKKGSTFSFSIRLKPSDELNVSEYYRNNNNQKNVTTINPLKILVAEDVVINQRYIEGLLKSFQHDITIVDNGRKVIKYWESQKFDCILMDIYMPKMDGLEATRIIREKEEKTTEHIPIIALTAAAFANDKRRIMASGMDDYIVKPIDEVKLFRVLAKVNQKQSAVRPGKNTILFETGSLIDSAMFNERFKKFSNEIIIEIIDEFLMTYSTDLYAIGQNILSKDFHLIKEITHKFKGELMVFCANDIVEIAYKIEKAALESSVQNMDTLFNRLQLNVNGLINELNFLRENLVSAHENLF